MAVEVIKSGIFGKTYQLECSKCHCIYNYNYIDTDPVSKYYSEGVGREIECPECGYKNPAILIICKKEEES